MAGDTFLEDINVLELSPTDSPANRARKIFQKSKQAESDPMFKTIEEYIEKSSHSAKCKEAMKSAFAELKKAKGEMSDEEWKKFQKAFGDEGEESQEAVKKSADALISALSIVKKSVEQLDQPTPIVGAALESLAALVGHKTVNRKIDELPPEVKAQFDMVKKSAEESQAQLVALKKSMADSQRVMLGKEYVAKAQQQYKHIPMASEDIGKLMLETNANESLLKLLDNVEGALKTNALCQESGFAAVAKAGGPISKTEKLVAEYMQKSATPITKAEAMVQVLKSHPEIFAEADRAQHEGR